MAPVTRLARELPWSVLQAEWFDVPIRQDAGHATPTWMAFSVSFDVCLRGVLRHVARCADDRAKLESIVTEVFAENLDILVSCMGDCDKLARLLSAADLLIERGAGPGRERGIRARRARPDVVPNHGSDD
jgi:hypothetical protein